MISTTFSKPVPSSQYWTYLCDVEAERTYDIKAVGIWTDWFIETDANGYEKSCLKPFEPLRRMPREKWFCLAGALDQDMKTAFRIGAAKRWVPPRSGKLWCFANDIKFMYWNNRASLTVSATSL